MAGGKRDGAGRPAGARNKATINRENEIKASGLTPLDYMLAVLRDESESPLMRMEAAKSAAPYVHPRLNAVEHTGGLTLTHEDALAMLAAGPDDADPDDALRGATTH